MAILEDPKESVVVPKTIGEQPGGLRNETRMTIQTREAQKIVVGRRGGKGVQPIIGLLNFGRRMKLLWLSAQADDPYADWHLLRIEESMNEARATINEKRQWLDETLNSMEGFDISVASSLEPIQVHILFQNPYGYMGAYLVADYDALCRSVFTAVHIGLLDRKTGNSTINAAGRMIRRTFDIAAQWKFTGVTREDIRVQSPIALKAINLYGECPEPVLKKEKRANISPEIRTRPKPVIKTKHKKTEESERNRKPVEKKTATSKKTAAEPKDEPEKRMAATVSLLVTE